MRQQTVCLSVKFKQIKGHTKSKNNSTIVISFLTFATNPRSIIDDKKRREKTRPTRRASLNKQSSLTSTSRHSTKSAVSYPRLVVLCLFASWICVCPVQVRSLFWPAKTPDTRANRTVHSPRESFLSASSVKQKLNDLLENINKKHMRNEWNKRANDRIEERSKIPDDRKTNDNFLLSCNSDGQRGG